MAGPPTAGQDSKKGRVEMRLISKQNNSSSSFVVVVMPELFMFHARARFPLSPTA
jgi:hypothetical protein